MLVSNPPKITHQELLALALEAKGSVKHLYLHWTAGRYGQFFDDYHLNVDKDGQVYRTCGALTERKAHTWKRNSGAVGVTLCCGLDAACGSRLYFGAAPPTQAQLRSMAWIIAIICTALELPIQYATVATHGEIAVADGYGPGSGDPDLRWDLLWVPDAADPKVFHQGGHFLRKLARQFSQRLRPHPPAELSSTQAAGAAGAAAPLQVPLLVEI